MGEYEQQALPGTPRRPPPARLSSLFERLAAEGDGPITVAEIRTALGDRSLATLLIFFAVINLIPLPPPSSAILGLPLLIVAAQMLYGSTSVWLRKNRVAWLKKSLNPGDRSRVFEPMTGSGTWT